MFKMRSLQPFQHVHLSPVEWMHEWTQRYEPVFFLSGGLTVLAACLLFLVPILVPSEAENKGCRHLKGFKGKNLTSKTKLMELDVPQHKNFAKINSQKDEKDIDLLESKLAINDYKDSFSRKNSIPSKVCAQCLLPVLIRETDV